MDLRGKSIKQIDDELKSKPGYKKSVVPTIYSWIFDKLLSELALEKELKSKSLSSRILSEDELRLIGIENYSKLLRLWNLEVLTTEDVNTLLDRLTLITDKPLSNLEFNIFLLSSLFEADRHSSAGSRLLLYIYDQIN